MYAYEPKLLSILTNSYIKCDIYGLITIYNDRLWMDMNLCEELEQ